MPRGGVGTRDSAEKLVHQLSLLTSVPVTYNGKVLSERGCRELYLSPTLFRQFICTAGCTACCLKFTLDYLPLEHYDIGKPQGFHPRFIEVNGLRKVLMTNDQTANETCDFLTAQRPDGGLGCGLWPNSPLACASAPQVQIIQIGTPGRTYIFKRPFGRAWRMNPKPQCAFVSGGLPSAWDLPGTLKLLRRFQAWGAYLGLPGHILSAAIHNLELIEERRIPVPAIPLLVYRKADA